VRAAIPARLSGASVTSKRSAKCRPSVPRDDGDPQVIDEQALTDRQPKDAGRDKVGARRRLAQADVDRFYEAGDVVILWRASRSCR